MRHFTKTPERAFIYFLLLVSCCLFTVRAAYAEEPANISADHMEYLSETKTYIAKGAARIVFKDSTLRADEMRLNSITSDAVATGNVVYEDPDAIITAEPSDFANGMDAYYTNVLKNLKPGLNCLLIHLAYDDAEMKAVTVDHPEWGAAWRQADYDFFTSRKCIELLQQQGIILVTWRELRDKIVRASE